LIIILITIIEDNKMVTKKIKTDSILHIIIGGNFSKDFDDLLNKKIDLTNSPKNAIYLDNFAQLNKLLSPSKLDLFKYLVEVQNLNDPKSLSVIAYNLKRKKEAISRDIKQLNNLGLIMLKKVKQTIYAIPKYNSIEIKTI
jgi:predicted transcriptional regulator